MLTGKPPPSIAGRYALTLPVKRNRICVATRSEHVMAPDESASGGRGIRSLRWVRIRPSMAVAMARVTRTAEWKLLGTRAQLVSAVNLAAAQHNLSVSSTGNSVEIVGGSQARMRLKGAWLSQDADLPKRGKVTISGQDANYGVTLAIEDAMGFGFMDRRTRKKYERILDNIVLTFGASLESNANPVTAKDTAAELERLADLHDRGAPERSRIPGCEGETSCLLLEPW